MPPPPDANFAASTPRRDSTARPLRGRNRCPYAVSKAGLEMLVKIYAGEVAKTRVRANLIDPGVVRTPVRAPGLSRRRPEPAAAARECRRGVPRLRPVRMHPQRRGRLGVVRPSPLAICGSGLASRTPVRDFAKSLTQKPALDNRQHR